MYDNTPPTFAALLASRGYRYSGRTDTVNDVPNDEWILPEYEGQELTTWSQWVLVARDGSWMIAEGDGAGLRNLRLNLDAAD